MKRVIFINAHWNHLLMNTMLYWIFKIKAPAKYSNLFNSLTNQDDVQVLCYVSSNASIIPRSFYYMPFSRWLSLKTCKYVLGKNGYKDSVKIICSLNDVRGEDVVVGFIHGRGCADDLELFNCRKIMHLNQFQSHSIQELNVAIKGVNEYMLEANVFKLGNYMLETCYPTEYKFHLLPYVVTERFKCIIPFSSRKRMAVATGTLARFEEDENDYIKHYSTPYLHKMRKVIFDDKDCLTGLVDSFISPYIESTKKGKKRKYRNCFIKYIFDIYHLAILKDGKQENYFSFNIVDKYNEYQMAVVPEEIAGCPAIGAFESMACGCAYIGIDHSMYKDLGLVSGEHYIAYDGTLEDLKHKIRYYQEHEKELEKIAMNGRKFVSEHNSLSAVIKKFISVLNVRNGMCL